MEGRESALILEVPEAEPLVGEWRLRHDSSASLGVPAHVTILYPFLPANELDEQTRERVAAIAAHTPGWSYGLVAVRRFANGLIYVAPEPVAPFATLTAQLEEAFALRAYGGAFDEVVHHLTVADGGAAEALSRIEASVEPGLPIRCRAGALALFVQDDGGRWRRDERFPLADA